MNVEFNNEVIEVYLFKLIYYHYFEYNETEFYVFFYFS